MQHEQAKKALRRMERDEKRTREDTQARQERVQMLAQESDILPKQHSTACEFKSASDSKLTPAISIPPHGTSRDHSTLQALQDTEDLHQPMRSDYNVRLRITGLRWPLMSHGRSIVDFVESALEQAGEH